MKTRLQFQNYALITFLPILLAGSLAAQAPQKKAADTTGRENSPFSRNEADLPKGPAPRTAQGHPDLSGYWIPFAEG